MKSLDLMTAVQWARWTSILAESWVGVVGRRLGINATVLLDFGKWTFNYGCWNLVSASIAASNTERRPGGFRGPLSVGLCYGFRRPYDVKVDCVERL